ncbi:hypothetical protein ACFFRR_008835 [Megaselia abdita]
MAATAKAATAQAAKTQESATDSSAATTQAEINMVVSDTEDDEEFLADDLSSFDEGVAPPEKDNPDLIILTRKIQELDEAKKWRQANPGDTNCVIKRPEQNPLHPNVYFDKYMGMKKLKAVEQKLRFARGVLRRFSGKDPKNIRTGNRIKLQRAEKILAKIVADHKGEAYVAPKHEVLPPTMTIEDLSKVNFRARNRIIIAAKKFVPKIESKPVADRTPWEEINYPFYKEVNAAFPEPVKASTEEIFTYNKKKNAIKAERKVKHKEDQLDKALNFIDYLLKYKDQNFTPMTKAKLERSFEIIQKQFKFQAAHKLEASKTQPTIVNKDVEKKKPEAKQPQKAQQKPANAPDNRKRPIAGGPAGPRGGNPAKIPRGNDNRNFNNSGGNFPRRPNQNYGGNGPINRVADIWSSVGAALNQLSGQSNNYNNTGGNFGGSQPDNFRGGRGGDQGRDNFNSNISDMLFNRGGGGGSVGNIGGGYNDGGRRFDDNVPSGRNFNDGGRYNNNSSFNDSRRLDDFNRSGSGGNFNQGNDFRGNSDFGGNSGYGGGNYGNSGGFNNLGGGGYGGLDLNRGNRAPIDDLFTRNRSRL